MRDRAQHSVRSPASKISILFHASQLAVQNVAVKAMYGVIAIRGSVGKGQ